MGHLHSGWTFLLPSTTFTFITSYNRFLRILIRSSLLSLKPFPPLLWQLTPWGLALPEASIQETACSVCCPNAPACLLAHVVGVSWAYLGMSHYPALPVPPSHPEAMGHSFPPPLSPSCFPGQVSFQDTQLPGVRMPHSSGLTPPGGGLWIPSWGVRWSKEAGREVGRGKFSTSPFGPLCPLLWDQGHRMGRTAGVPRAPSRVGKRNPLTLFGFKARSPHCRHRRNCKKPKRTQRTVTGLSSCTCKIMGLA